MWNIYRSNTVSLHQTKEHFHPLTKAPLCHLRVTNTSTKNNKPGNLSTCKQACLSKSRQTCQILTLGDRAFSIAGPKAWNNLPQSVRAADSLDSFKRKLKFHLLTHVSVFEQFMYVYSYCNALSARFSL